jgi:hypothetical protein
MLQRRFKLKTSVMAILSEDQQTMVTIPANALATLIVGDVIDEIGFVQVRYRGDVVILFSEDLRTCGERAWDNRRRPQHGGTPPRSLERLDPLGKEHNHVRKETNQPK